MTGVDEPLDHLGGRLRVFAGSLHSGYSPIGLRVALQADADRTARVAEKETRPALVGRAEILRSRQLGLLASVCVAAGDVPAARRNALLARNIGRSVGDRRAETFASIRRAVIELHHGTAFDACKLATIALEQARSPLARQAGDDLYGWAAVTLARAAARRSREDRPDMLGVYKRARRMAELAVQRLPGDELGALTVTAPQIWASLGDAAADAGEEDAVELLETGLSAYPSSARLVAVRTSLNLSRALALTGRSDEAVTTAMETLREVHRYERPGDGEVRERALKVVAALENADGARELARLAMTVC